MLRVSVIGFGVVCLGLFGPSCAGPESGEPSPSLSQTRASQVAFRNIVRRWFEDDDARRPLLRPALERFVARYPTEPRAANARVLLAWLAITAGQHAEARRLLAEARASGAPSVRDFAEVAEARLLLAEQKPDAALAKLTRLEGKLVDPTERLIATELRLQAALACRRFDEALRALTTYLAAAPVDWGDRVRARAESALGGLPESALEASLSELDAKARRGSLSPPDVWLRRVVRERLIRRAVEQKDGKLARRLLDSHPGLAGKNELSNELLQLAASAASAADVQGVFVGFVLETGDPDVERRSASVARGLSEALSASLPGAESLPIVVRASDAHRVGDALTELESAGALSLVAGVSDASAEQAATWAVSGRSPVLIVRDTPELVISEMSFVLGTSDIDQLDAIQKELARRNLSRWARVGSGGFDCRATAEKAGQARFPVKAWRAENVEALALLSPRACTMEVFAEVREERLALLLAIGLESSEVLGSLSGKRFALGAGAFPNLRGAADMAPDFYEALGHDGGTLVRTAWSNMGGLSAAPDAAQRTKLPSVLSDVTVQLGTTDSMGFGGKRRLPRRLIIREAP